MASISKDKAGNYSLSFRWRGKRYLRAIGTKDADIAQVAKARVEEVMLRLKRGWLVMPAGADVGAFMISGGVLTEKPSTPDATPLTVAGLVSLYSKKVKKRPNTMATILLHLNHAVKIFGADTAVASIRVREARKYCEVRASARHHGRPTRPYTIRKEMRTFLEYWKWAFEEKYILVAPEWTTKSLRLPPDPGREPFRTFDEIEARIARGGYKKRDLDELWECLYLQSNEVQAVLEYVASQPAAPFVLPMVALAAMTGARRAELLRSRIDDIDLEKRTMLIRELKRDTSREFTTRQVDLHPRLVAILEAWFKDHPGGHWTLCNANRKALTGDQATDHLNRVLGRHERWSKMPAFHTFRHSFASILASKGVDQRIIDALMGHQTEEMKRRYQHVFPLGKRRAVDDLFEPLAKQG